MERCRASLEDQRMQETLFQAITGKGAFDRFKDRIIKEGVREDWFAFKHAACKGIAAEFLQNQGISYSDEKSSG